MRVLLSFMDIHAILVMLFAISHSLADDYQVTVEYILCCNEPRTMTLNCTGSLVDPGSGSRILTIALDSEPIDYFPGFIFGSFNNINLTYSGTTGEITGDWDVINPFNPASEGPVLIPLNDGGDISAWNPVVPLTGGSSSAVFNDPAGVMNILSWSIKDLDGPDSTTEDSYIQINSNVVYELNS